MTQLIAHEITHCLQFDKLGLIKSNPIANIPNWKWEGYAEYVSRRNADQKDLSINIDRFIETNQKNWEIKFVDSTITPREYYGYWMLVQYCLDIKKMSYQLLLTDTTSEQSTKQEMRRWYEKTKANAQHRIGNMAVEVL